MWNRINFVGLVFNIYMSIGKGADLNCFVLTELPGCYSICLVPFDPLPSNIWPPALCFHLLSKPHYVSSILTTTPYTYSNKHCINALFTNYMHIQSLGSTKHDTTNEFKSANLSFSKQLKQISSCPYRCLLFVLWAF